MSNTNHLRAQISMHFHNFSGMLENITHYSNKERYIGYFSMFLGHYLFFRLC